MKTVVILLPVLLIAATLHSQAHSEGQSANPHTSDEITWKAVNDSWSRCMAINSKGQIFAGTWGMLLSSDNGNTWIMKSFPNNTYEVNTMAVTSEDIIYVTTFERKLFRSVDDGVNWIQLFIDSTNISFTCVAVNSLDEIFAGTEYSGLLRVTDGDSLKVTGWSGPVEKLGISPDNDLFILSNQVFRSTDGGNIWTLASTGLTNTGINAFAFNSKGHVFAGTAASNGGVFVSKDKGDLWTSTKYAFYEDFDSVVTAVATSSRDELFIGTLGKGVFILGSDESTLIPANTGLPEYRPIIFCFFFAPDGHVLAGTSSGIYLTVQPVTSGYRDFPMVSAPFSLEQNFPNPFGHQTTIKYTLRENIHTNITVFNAAGQLVETLLDQQQLPGNHQIIWDGSVHGPGVYFYRIQSGDNLISRKMVVIGK
jgi:hypothetical protein